MLVSRGLTGKELGNGLCSASIPVVSFSEHDVGTDKVCGGLVTPYSAYCSVADGGMPEDDLFEFEGSNLEA